LTEPEPEHVFKLVVTKALAIRGEIPPSKGCMRTKVHLDYSKTILGTETRFMGGLLATGGDADYSRALPSSMCDAHDETNNMNLNTLQ